ncbi:MAG: DUF3710 domain-containing protein [Corynebacterium sp.]|uniref:DUF3710 domain-containing protein n=1 Tax=Corynebacterium sp. TaxID=1720 RepID=UPI0026DDA543|nr:DUF3710 domain-containing protein [Corynebacterium sp.]MDO4760693.1 DUF3710 domain-containing protein [Corynebacterium sp.]
MALWPFGKKKEDDAAHTSAEMETQPVDETIELVGENLTDNEAALEGDDDDLLAPDPIHDAVEGESGPFDGDTVAFEDFDFSDFGQGALNLGSLLIPLPHGSEVQVEMGPEGPSMLHILTQYGRCTPVAFAAPRSPGQWRETVRELSEDMRSQGLEVTIEYGPWGREIVGSREDGGGIVRILGVDGPRWMLRMTLAAPTEHADAMAQLGREITARTFVYRGSEPILAGTSLPVALPQPLAEQVQKEMERRQRAQNQAQTTAQGFPNNPSPFGTPGN